METEIHQTFCDILHFDSGTSLPLADIKDALVGNGATLAPVQDGEIRLETSRHVVGIENGQSARGGKTVRTHHAEIHPADDADAGTAPWSSADLADGPGTAGGHDGVAREVRGKMLGNTDRSDAGATSPVRNAEGLVKIEMADIGADAPGTAQADLGIHVGAIHVDLATGFVHERAYLPDPFLEDTVGRGISDHEGGKTIPMERDLGFEIVNIDIAIRIAGHTDDLHTDHGGAGGIGSMGGNRDETDGTMPLPSGQVVGPDDEKSRVLTL